MNVTIKKSILKGRVAIISSKSHLHRALIAACFSDNRCRIFCDNNSDDILVTINIIKSLGSNINQTRDYIDVDPIDKRLLFDKVESDHKFTFYCRQSATSFRFFLAISSVLGLNADFILDPSLRKRKIDSIYDFLIRNKINLRVENEIISINGRIKASELIIDASLSSQFLSGMLLGAGILDEEIKIIVDDNKKIVSKGYVLMTLRVLEDFSVKIINEKNSYIKQKNSTYKNNFSEYHIEGDFSNAGFFLALKLLSEQNNNIIIENLPKNSIQPDKIIIDILKKMGIEMSYNNDLLICKSNSSIQPIDIDIIDNPDILPVLAIFSAFANGTSIFHNVDRLKIKESNRVFGIIKILKAFKIYSSCQNNALYIKGGIANKSSRSPIYIDTNFDHRMVMLSCTLSCLIDRNVTIKDAEFVSKSDPLFFKRLADLGANITYL